MNFSTYRFTLDLQKHQSQMSIATFQYDTAVKLSIGLTDGGVPYYLDDGCTAVLYGKKAKGDPIVHTCSIEGNSRIIYQFNNKTANEIGIVDCQIRIYKEGEEIISAPKFIIVVAERVTNDAEVFDAGDGAFEEQFSALDNLFTQESGRVIAENARVEAENERQGNELLRKEKELSRIEFETQRQTDEVKRVKAEEERTEAEDARVEAEKLRQVQYDNIENIMYKATEGLSYTLSSDGTYYEVSGIGTATDTDIVMPMFYEDLPVKRISENAFENNTKINSITIPESITSIGDYAFSGCTRLTKINFNAVKMHYKMADNYVFSNAGKDATGINVTIGKNVTEIPAYLFAPHHTNMSIAPNIKSVVFEDGCVCQKIGQCAFWQCRNLTNIVFPTGLTFIGYGAFGHAGFTKVKLPDNLDWLDGSVFLDCSSLLSIILPKSITTMGANNFVYCEKLTIYCEAESKPSGWHSAWNEDERPVVWGVPLDFPGVNEKLEEYKSESKEYADGIKNDLLNGAGPAYDTLKELGNAIDENKDALTVIQEIANNKLDKTNEANKIYGTDANGNQIEYNAEQDGIKSGVALRVDGGYINQPNPTQDGHGANKRYVDGLVKPLEDRVTDLENLTLSYSEDTSIDYEKAVPADVGKPARVKMIGGATEKVPVTKNILDPNDLSFYTADTETGISHTLNADGTITYTIGFDGVCSFELHDFPVGRYCLYLENATIMFFDEGNIDLALSSDYDPESGNTEPTTKTLKVMLWLDESVTTDVYEIREVDNAVFEPYTLGFQDAEVERVENIGADGETLLRSIAIPFEAIKTKIDGFGKAVNDTYYDYIEFVDDKVFGYKVADEMVFNGTEAWKNNGNEDSPNNYYLLIISKDKTKYISRQILSDKYEQYTLSSTNREAGIDSYVTSVGGGGFAVRIRPIDVSSYTVASFKESLKANPITVRLALATPEVKDITDLFTEGNELQVQRGGAIRFVNERKMAIPNTIAFIKRKE